MSIKEREEFLFQKLREKDPDIVADGVICEQEFLNLKRSKWRKKLGSAGFCL